MSEQGKASIAEMALQYALSKPYINQVLIGVDSLEQLDHNLAIASQPLKKDIIQQLDAISISEETLLNPANWN